MSRYARGRCATHRWRGVWAELAGGGLGAQAAPTAPDVKATEDTATEETPSA